MVGHITIRSLEGHFAASFLRKQAKGNFGKSKQDFFLRKTDKFCANRPHTAPGGVVCRGTAGGFFEHML